MSLMSNWGFVSWEMGGWREVAAMGLLVEGMGWRRISVNEERGCLSGPSCAFLLVNCREKKKKKKKKRK